MQRFRAIMTAACLAAGMGVGLDLLSLALGVSAASANEDLKPEDAVQTGPSQTSPSQTSPSQTGLQTAAYDVILIPRAGGMPHVLTERGWRALSQQRPRSRTWSRRPAYNPRAYNPTGYNPPGYNPPAFDRPSYETRQHPTREYSRWASRNDYRDTWPSDPPRWTGHSNYRQSQRQRLDQ